MKRKRTYDPCSSSKCPITAPVLFIDATQTSKVVDTAQLVRCRQCNKVLPEEPEEPEESDDNRNASVGCDCPNCGGCDVCCCWTCARYTGVG